MVHLNELNELDIRTVIKLFRIARPYSRKCDTLVLSFEDVRPSEYPNFRRLTGQEIRIQRASLEVISSRFHNLNKKANLGIGWSRQSCDAYFMETLQEMKEPPDSSDLCWSYNEWLHSPTYRAEFLEELGLTFDEMPPHSSVGGGSSFHGTSGRIESDLEDRLLKVSPQKEWRAFLSKTLQEHPELFSEQEKAIAAAYLSD